MTLIDRIHKPLGAVLALAAVAAPAAAQASDQLQLKGSKASETPAVFTDVRSPDAKDAAVTSGPPQATVVRVVEDSDFDWGDAGIGAGTVLVISLLAINGTALVARRRLERAAGL